MERKNKKNIRPVFFTVSNDIFYFFEYRFSDDNIYNSLVLVNRKKYVINQETITNEDIQLLASKVKPYEKEPNVPFPQADDFTKVIDLLGYLYEEDMTKSDIAEQLDFDKRQADYYFNSCVYLGLAKKEHTKDGIYAQLNDEGRRILELPYREKRLALAEKILQHGIFNEIFHKLREVGNLKNDYIVERMKQHQLYQISSDSTYYRRASTIKSWLNWILNLPNL